VPDTYVGGLEEGKMCGWDKVLSEK